MRRRVLLLGAGGMLGSSFAHALDAEELTTAGRAELGSAASVRHLFDRATPALVINCAAHTDVEGAEREPEPAIEANARLPGVVASLARDTGALLVHISSTGCYGDWKSDPYSEDDPARPTTAHHRSKLAGEVAVSRSGAAHLIVRAGWLFGGAAAGAKNFVWNRLVEALGKDRMISDPFQVGCPTFVGDVVRQTLAAAETGVTGIVNVVSQGATTRFGYVSRIVAAAELPCRVYPADAPFARLAKVSPNEAALNARLGKLGLDQMPSWESAVDGYVAAMLASPSWRQLLEPTQ